MHFPIDLIKDDISARKNSFSREYTYYLFAALSQDNGIKPFFNDQEVQSAAIEELFNRYAGKGGDITKGGICSVCGEEKEKLYGNFSLLKCYNLDKRGMITGGFHKSQGVHNFPVCRECIADVTYGLVFAKENLSFWMSGENYFLLPKVRNVEIKDMLIDILSKRSKRKKIPTLKEVELQSITADESELLEEIAELTKGKDTITLSLIFYEEKNAAWRIIAEINEVLPSRIKAIYAVKEEIDRYSLLFLSQKERENSRYFFDLRKLKAFAGHDGKQSRKIFLDWVDAVFRSGKIDRKNLITKLVKTILNQMKENSDYYAFTVRDAWAVFLFLIKLKAIDAIAGGKSMKLASTNPYGTFIKENPDFFTQPEQVVSFLTGCYVSAVIYVQRQSKNKAPFFKKVHGLKLDKRRLQELYPEARNKLHQYDKFGLVAKTLDPLLAEAWVKVGNSWDINDTEATFAFTVGLALSGNIVNPDKSEQEEDK